MKLNKRLLTLLAISFFLLNFLFSNALQAQESANGLDATAKKKKDKSDTSVKKVKLFKDDVPLQLTITTDIRQLTGEKEKAQFQKAAIVVKLPDSTEVKENIELRARGNFRRQYCYIPSLMLNFESSVEKRVASLKKIKMVTSCRIGREFDQLVLKEYTAYRIFNLLSDMSYKVRLVNVLFLDSEGKKKPTNQFGFIIEDVDDMAKRNGCSELKLKKMQQEAADRNFMTLVVLFQYMIGNTDWSVPGDHNVKLLQRRDSAAARPFAVPYDFDFSGLVNASYATPDEQLGTSTVTERVYRGFPRTVEELQEAAAIFNNKKTDIYKLITDSQFLDKRSKDEMTKYLDEYYQVINSPRGMKKEFIDNARTN